MLKRIMSRFFVESFCLAVPKTLQDNPSELRFEKFPVANKFVDEKDGGGSIKTFCRNFFVSQCAKKLVGDPLRCHRFRVSKNFMLKRIMSRYFVDFFCLAVPKNVAGEPSCAVFRKVSGGEKVCG